MISLVLYSDVRLKKPTLSNMFTFLKVEFTTDGNIACEPGELGCLINKRVRRMTAESKGFFILPSA
jgi:hypothetical protein